MSEIEKLRALLESPAPSDDVLRTIAAELIAVVEAAREVCALEGYESGRSVRHAGHALTDDLATLDARLREVLL